MVEVRVAGLVAMSDGHMQRVVMDRDLNGFFTILFGF